MIEFTNAGAFKPLFNAYGYPSASGLLNRVSVLKGIWHVIPPDNRAAPVVAGSLRR